MGDMYIIECDVKLLDTRYTRYIYIMDILTIPKSSQAIWMVFSMLLAYHSKEGELETRIPKTIF